MRYIIENGTDGACMALYDMEALPDNYDISDDDASPDFEELQEQGKCIFIHTDGDGGHWLHLYIDEQEPEDLKKYSISHINVPGLIVPSGKLFYTGCEYVSKEEVDYTKIAPQDAQFLDIEKGSYDADIHFLQYPDSYINNFKKNKLSKKSRKILAIHKALGYLALIGIGLSFGVGSTVGLIGILLCLIPLASWFLMFWTSGYGKADDEREKIMSELPAILAKFDKN